MRAAGYHVDNCLIDFAEAGCRFVFNYAAQSTPTTSVAGTRTRWHDDDA